MVKNVYVCVCVCCYFCCSTLPLFAMPLFLFLCLSVSLSISYKVDWHASNKNNTSNNYRNKTRKQRHTIYLESRTIWKDGTQYFFVVHKKTKSESVVIINCESVWKSFWAVMRHTALRATQQNCFAWNYEGKLKIRQKNPPNLCDEHDGNVSACIPLSCASVPLDIATLRIRWPRTSRICILCLSVCVCVCYSSTRLSTFHNFCFCCCCVFWWARLLYRVYSVCMFHGFTSWFMGCTNYTYNEHILYIHGLPPKWAQFTVI